MLTASAFPRMLRLLSTRAALWSTCAALLCALVAGHAQAAADIPELPPAEPVYETLSYSMQFDGGENAWGYRVRLFTDRSVLYTGYGKAKTQGRRVFTISQEQYDSLLRAFEYANFMRMRDPRGGGSDSTLVITHTVDGRSHTLRTRDPGPAWPKPLYQLLYSMENVLRVSALACPVRIKVNKDEEDACLTREQEMEKYYPRPRSTKN